MQQNNSMKKFITNKNVYSVILSVVLSFAFVAVSVFASSTISTNISTDGTLTVSGVSTMNGNVTLGDVAGDVILSTGTLHASSTFLVTGATTLYGTTTIITQPLLQAWQLLASVLQLPWVLALLGVCL